MMNMLYKIAIDHANANYISGWCFHRLDPERTVRLLCLRGGTVVGSATADRFREDVRELGIHPTGRCGFEIVLSRDDEDGQDEELQIVPEGSKRVLAVLSAGGGYRAERRGILGRLGYRLLFRKRPGRTLVFMHIPKTAGTSFNTMIGSLMPRRRIVSHIELIDPALYRTLPQRYEYVSGHLRLGVLKDSFAHGNASFFTIVREPYDQLHSHLKWLIATAADPSDTYFKYNNPVIYELGTRLAGTDCSNPEALGRFARDLSAVAVLFLDNMQTRYFLDHEPPRVMQADVEQAVAGTSTFTLLGRTEYYSEFVERFIAETDLAARAPVRTLNKSEREPLFDCADEAVRAALLPLVRYDLEVYEHIAKTRLPDGGKRH